MSESLYERLGGEKGITAIAGDVVDNHMKNPKINARFQETDPKELKRLAAEFFCMGSGGPQKYTGKDMVAAHKGMNISEEEFIAVLDDAMDALDKNGIDGATKNEVLGIFYSLKGEVVRL